MRIKDELIFAFSEKVLAKNLTERQKVTLQTKELIKRHNIDRNSVFIDVGSNWGDVLKELVATQCKVYSFEPHPEYSEILGYTYTNNPNFFMYKAAVWSEDIIRPFFFKGHNIRLNGGATLMAEKTNIYNDSKHTAVQCLDIARIVKSIDRRIDVLKLDVEGAEWNILHRLYETGTYLDVKAIYVENHSRKIPRDDISGGDYHTLKEKVIENYKRAGIPLYWW